MTSQQHSNTEPDTGPNTAPEPPWYRQFWPWFIIALPAASIIAGIITVYLALTRPFHLIVGDEEYRRLNDELKAHTPVQEIKKEDAGGTDSSSG